MASRFFRKARLAIVNGTIALPSDTLQVMLVDDTYAPAAGDEFVDDGSANDPASHEISTTGYVGGYSGNGRRTITGKTFQEDTSNDRIEFVFADVTYSALATGATIGGAVLHKRGSSDDTTGRLIAFYDLANTPTNGSDVTIDVDPSEGTLHL